MFVECLLTGGSVGSNSSEHLIYLIYSPVHTQPLCQYLISLAVPHMLSPEYISCFSQHYDKILNIDDLSWKKKLILAHCFKECHLIMAGKGR